jgi:hypothetical protein
LRKEQSPSWCRLYWRWEETECVDDKVCNIICVFKPNNMIFFCLWGPKGSCSPLETQSLWEAIPAGIAS